MNAPKHRQGRPACAARARAAVAMDCATPIAVILPGSRVHAVADGGMG